MVRHKYRTYRGTRARKHMEPNQIHDHDHDEFRLLVNSMTNWQRNQWNRSGHPGLSKRSVKVVREYLELIGRGKGGKNVSKTTS